jgi:hypothetical protein
LKLIKKVLLGKNVFAVLPTGGGKSLILQMPAFLAEPKHVAIIFSPLIALMKDQVERCNQAGIAAATMSSDQSEEQQQEIYSALRRGKLRVLFIAPERLKNKEFIEAISKCALSFIAIDECLTKDTDIRMSNGATKKLSECTPGDTLESFTEDNRVVHDRIKAIHPRGKRKVYRVKFENEKTLDCTSGEKIWTGEGWLYLREIFPDIADHDSVRDASGDATGRLFHPMGETRAWAYTDKSRSNTGEVQPAQSQSVAPVCCNSSQDSKERWLRQNFMLFQHRYVPTIRRIERRLLPKIYTHRKAEKDRHKGVVRCFDVALHSLLVYGRRKFKWKQRHFSYRRISVLGIKNVEPTTHRHGVPCDNFGVRWLHDDPIKNRTIQDPSEEHRGVRNTEHAVQVRSAAGSLRQMSYMRKNISGQECASCSKESMLWVACVPGEFRASAQKVKLCGEQEPCLSLSKIISAEYIGYDDVFDIETEEYHTFFANDIAVHNCHTIRDRSSYRPGFSEIIKFSALFPDVPKLALTATADEEVEREVIRSLRMTMYDRVVAPPRRENISYEARTNMTEQDLMREIRRVGEGSKIVYCASRKSAEAMASLLKGHGLSAECYHAGLDKHIKNKAQDSFKDGEVEIMCATNAFGLGIDVANVRLVVSWHLPQDVFEMVQLAGRGGRDGLPARFILNVSKEGLRLRNYFTNIGNPKIYIYQRIWEYLCRKVKPKGILRLPESALAKVAGCPTGMEGWAMSALSYMEHHRLLSSSAGTKTYRLPVQNMELARGWAKRVGGDIIHGKLVFTVTQNEDDPASRIWNSGACAKDAPDSALAIRRIARAMTITERDLIQKKNKDSVKIDDLVMFAGTADKAAYIDACFLKSEDIK